ncbi:MAG: stage III sporulation protein AF [Clostridiales bacterium]|jgi:hypothetical protein|nr:stage III sporulation protein AF [Clostridiales bacterium]
MSGISVWITTILAVVIIGVIVDLLLSGNRMHKFIRGIFGIITIFVIAMPLPSLIKNGFNWKFDWGGSINIDQGFLDAVEQRQIKILEQGTENMLKSNNVLGAIVSIKGKIEKLKIQIEQVTVNLTDAVINNDNSNINSSEFVTSLVSKGLNIERSMIIIIG